MENVVTVEPGLLDRLRSWVQEGLRWAYRRLFQLWPRFPVSLVPRLADRMRVRRDIARYRAWASAPDRCRRPFEFEAVGLGPGAPRLSIVTPVFDNPPRYFRALVDSLVAQDYTGYEWVIVDDGSRKPETRTMLAEALQRCPRARLVVAPENGGIARATALGAREARHEWLVFVDADDVLAPDAISCVAKVASSRPEVRFIYSDMDHMDERGRRLWPVLKPDCSPELILGTCYSCHLHAMTRSLFGELEMRARQDFSTDWPLIIRAFRRPETIYHIPRILYSWRKHGAAASSVLGLPASGLSSEEAARVRRIRDSQRAAVETYLLDRGLTGLYAVDEVPIPGATGCFYFRYVGTAEPPVTLFAISAGDGARAEEVLRTLTRYSNLAVCRVVAGPGGRAASLDHALASLRTPYVAVVEEGLEPRTPDWLREAVGLLEREPTIGLVAPKVLSPEGAVLHVGLTVGGDRAGLVRTLAFGPRGAPRPEWEVRREVWGVAGGIWVARADALARAGPWGSEGVGDAYYEADLSLRLRRAGYRVVFDPCTLAVRRHGGLPNATPDEARRFAARHAEELLFDPYCPLGAPEA